MDVQSQNSGCQLTAMKLQYEPTTVFGFVNYAAHRLYWAIFRRLRFAFFTLTHPRARTGPAQNEKTHLNLQPGALVRVKSEEAIRATLNGWNELKGCTFIDEMWAYCGSTQKVYKKVENFVDERDFRVKRVKGLYILENVFCEGPKILGKCDRSCFFFWREEWLEKVDA